MSLTAGSIPINIAPRAGQVNLPRQIAQAINFGERAQIPEINSVKRSEDFADVVARQLPNVVAAGMVAAPVMRRVTRATKPFVKRATPTEEDENYVGPVELDQEEFHNSPSRVRRQVQSQGAKPFANWQSADIGYVMARYTNGTELPVTVGNVVYAIRGSDDSCGYDDAQPTVCMPLPQLQVTLSPKNGGTTVPTGTVFAMKDVLSATLANYASAWVGIGPSQNSQNGNQVPYWMEPEAGANYLWTMDGDGVLSATHPTAGLLKFAANENRLQTSTDPNSPGYYPGNGDVDAWPVGGTIFSDHKAIVLYLSKTPSTL